MLPSYGQVRQILEPEPRQIEWQQGIKNARAWIHGQGSLLKDLSPSPHWAPLMSFLPGAMSAVVLVSQDQVVTVSFGESATLRYSMEGEMINNYYISWYRKTQDIIMNYIHQEGGMYGPGVLNKFWAYIDNSKKQAVLDILKASERDEGICYCASNYHTSAGPFMSSPETIEINAEQQF